MDEENKLPEGAAAPPEAGNQEETVANQPSETVSLEKPAAQETENTNAQTENAQTENAQTEDGSVPEVTDPVYVNQTAPTAPEAAPQKSNKGVIAGVVALVIIAVVGVLAGPKLFANPLAKVITAMAKTSENGLLESPMEQATGISAAMEAAAEGKSSIKTQLVLEEVPESMATDGIIPGLGIYYQLDTDMENESFYFDIGVLMDAAKLMHLELYGTEETASLAIPELVNGYFTMPLKNIGAAYKQSIFNSYQNIDIPDDYSFSFFGTEGDGEEEAFPDEIAALTVKHAEWGKRLQEDVTVEKINQADIMIGDGTTVSCQGYEVSITDEKANQLYQDYIHFWETDEDAQAFLDYIISAYTVRNTYGNVYYAQQMEEEMRENLEIGFEEMRNIALSNMSYTCYVDNNDIIRQNLFTGTISDEDDSLDVELDLQLLGEYRAVDNFIMDFRMTMDEETLALHMDNQQFTDDDKVIAMGSVALGSDYMDVLTGDYTFTYNTSDSSYDLDANMVNDMDDTITIQSKGLLEIPNMGKSFAITMDTIDFAVTEYGEMEKLGLSGLISLDELMEPLKQPSGTEYKVFEMDEGQFQAVVFEIYGNIMRLDAQLEGILN